MNNLFEFNAKMLPIVEAMTTSFVHSLWIGLALSVLLKLVLSIIKQHYSVLRYRIALTSLMLFVVTVSSIFLYTLNKSSSPTSASTSFNSLHFANQVLENNPQYSVEQQLLSLKNTIYTYQNEIILFWFIGFLAFSLRFIGGFHYLKKLKYKGFESHNTKKIQQNMEALCHKLSLSRPVKVLESTLIEVPIVMGHFKPLILLPAGLISGLSTAELEAILLHELSHIKRNDYFVSVLQHIVETVFFFNPGCWWISKLIKNEREHCCDDMVLQHHENRIEYAKALGNVQSFALNKTFALGLAEEKQHLLSRIKRIMKTNNNNNNNNNRIIPILMALVIVASFVWIQNIDAKPLKKENTFQEDPKEKKKKKSREKQKQDIAQPIPKAAPAVIQEPVPEKEKTPNLVFKMDKLEVLHILPEDIELSEQEILELAEVTNTVATRDALMALEGLDRVAIAQISPQIASKVKTVMRTKQIIMDTLPDAELLQEQLRVQEKLMRQMLEMQQKEIQMMKEKMNALYQANLQQRVQLSEKETEEMHKRIEEEIKHAKETMYLSQKEIEKTVKKEMALANQHMKEMEVKLKDFEKKMQVVEKKFHTKMETELVKDGYFKKGESIRNVQHRDDVISVNGVDIKDKHYSKYKKMLEQFEKEVEELSNSIFDQD